ncbi:MAG: pyridoxal phosphate-dependent aminotransferase [Limisphaerales bacterium]
MKSSLSLVRPLVRRLKPYVPGEQPRIKGLIKLNTNENPYPPSPRVLEATRAGVDAGLRLYPSATARPLRERLARLHHCRPENFIVGNGSDELLNLAVRAFVEPLARSTPNGPPGVRNPARPPSRSVLQYFVPSYSLYPVLADIQGAARLGLPLKPDFGLPSPRELRRGKLWDSRAALTIITTPNAPTGRGYSTAELEALCREHKGVVLLDEAYVNFARQHALDLALKYPHVLVARTFSKAYCLCFQRVGYLVGHPDLIDALHKIRDSYNVNGLGQIAALATLGALPYYRANFRAIIHTRERLASELAKLGFTVFPSQTNFILARPPAIPAEAWLQELRERKILVRWFDQPEVRDYLRITVGTPAQASALIAAAREIRNKLPRRDL